jgi:hypothetical protein
MDRTVAVELDPGPERTNAANHLSQQIQPDE